jgi:tRNA acetyltransferase TAN1
MFKMIANLIVSTFRHGEEDARDEIDEILREFGDPSPQCYPTKISGIVFAHSTIDPFEVSLKLRNLVRSEPWKIHYILRVLPLEIILPATLENILNASNKLRQKINDNESFRITIEKRHTSMSSSTILTKVASVFANKVSLKRPDWIVLIEIVGDVAGISILRPDHIFSSVLEKRNNAI